MKHPNENPSDSSNTRLVGRRKLMKVLAAGGGVVTGAALIPDRWTSPIVEAVGLPAHAQTSPPSPPGPEPTDPGPEPTDPGPNPTDPGPDATMNSG